MLFPTDAYELVHAQPYLSGNSPNANFLPGAQPVKHFYGNQLPEQEWPKTAPPFIVWVPDRDTYDTNKPQQVKLVLQGRVQAIEAPERCRAGHKVHIFVKRTKDLACYRELFALVSRFRIACRYALNTTANYEARGGLQDGERDRERYPGLLRYEMDLAPYVPVLDVPNALALIETVDVVSSKGIDPNEV